MPAGSDDEAVTSLAVAAAGGNTAALAAFVKATQHDVWRFVAYLCDGASADDLTQETFLRAIGAIPRFSARSSARTWLLAIARRVVADHIRYLQSRPRTAGRAGPDQLPERDRSTRGFEDVVEVTMMIAGLTTDQREALLLTQLFGLSYRDAALVCGCAVGTIRSRVARARDALLRNSDSGRDDLTG
ncbi:MAG TPA: RNA polymerase sigma factor SigC [Mycobacterium sp.]